MDTQTLLSFNNNKVNGVWKLDPAFYKLSRRHHPIIIWNAVTWTSHLTLSRIKQSVFRMGTDMGSILPLPTKHKDFSTPYAWVCEKRIMMSTMTAIDTGTHMSRVPSYHISPLTSNELFYHNSLDRSISSSWLVAGRPVWFLSLLCFIEIPVFSANNVDPDQMPRSTLFANYPSAVLGYFRLKWVNASKSFSLFSKLWCESGHRISYKIAH